METDRDRTICGPSVAEESVLVAEGGLENVVVRIEVPGARAAPRTAVLDQQGCRYRPRVQAVAPGSTLELRNGDPVLHNVHGYAGAATAFNVPMPTPGGTTPRTLTRPGVIRMGCDVHAWMSASVLVTETPLVVVTGPGGRFELKDVPAGLVAGGGLAREATARAAWWSRCRPRGPWRCASPSLSGLSPRRPRPRPRRAPRRAPQPLDLGRDRLDRLGGARTLLRGGALSTGLSRWSAPHFGQTGTGFLRS